MHHEAAAPTPVDHSHDMVQDHNVGQGHNVDHNVGHVHNEGPGHNANQGNNGLQFPSSAREAREKMSKRKSAKATGMTLKDKYDLLQQL